MQVSCIILYYNYCLSSRGEDASISCFVLCIFVVPVHERRTQALFCIVLCIYTRYKTVLVLSAHEIIALFV